MTALDRAARDLLIDELCLLYPSYDELRIVLDLKLGRALANLSDRDALVQVVFRVVKAAEASGWIDDLVTAAAADSPHSTVLRQLADALPPEPVPARDLEVVVVAPPHWETLAAAVQADDRVRAVGGCTSAEALRGGLGAADALVVSSEILCAGERPLLGSVPVVLLETGRALSPGRTLAHALAERVTQIVVAGEPRDTARRIVDHLAAVVETS